MCGIVAVVGPGPSEGLPGALGAIRHRGPDSEGAVEGRGWAMGIRRLAIIDVRGGDQPIANEDKTIWVVCNGEIYNHTELRTHLRRRGHTFRTGSDVEVIVHLYEEYGERFVEYLQGMFGLFLATPDGCFVARDRLGIKPLYQMARPGGMAFASEIRALLELPGAPLPSISDQRLADYFVFRYVPEPHTAFVGIDRFPAGQITRIDSRGQTSRQYWTLEPQPAFTGTFDDAVAECEARLNSVVSSHLMSERPTGVFLSGGLDSSVLAALAVRQSNHPMPMLTASFPGSDLDEARYASQVAAHLGTEHHIVELGPTGYEDLQRSVDVVEDLVSDPALIPFLEVSRRARETLTVALVGEGSDETNVGYRSFLLLNQMLRRRRLGKFVPLVRPTGLWAMRLGLPNLDEAAFLARFTNTAFPVDEYPPLLPHLQPPADRIRDEILRLVPHPGSTLIGRNRLFRLAGWMKDDLLIKVDKTTMAASIEARVPFLDHTYVEWCLSLPDDFVLRNGQTKAVLRALAARLLPERIATRKQHGLVVPLERLLSIIKPEQLQIVLRRPSALWRRVFEERPVLALLERFKRGDHATSFFVYQMLNAELWRDRWCDASRAQTVVRPASVAALSEGTR
jgi:asparagine synthase (glutamine-hydrolysing)